MTTGRPARIGIAKAAYPAWQRLSAALRDAPQVPCAANPDAFTGDDADDRAHAATACLRCPVIAQCREFADANRETFGVWAGTDRGVGKVPTPTTTKETTK